ncbi:MAG: ectoine/hydroxyectoine ABC transporter substrate-binding protein EhuB, partial [Thermocrispum sp.]
MREMGTGEWTRRDLFRRSAVAGIAVVSGPALLSACGDGEPRGRGGNTLATGREQGLLRVGIANEPPYTKVTPDGNVTGVEPEILRAVLKKIGIDDI